MRRLPLTLPLLLSLAFCTACTDGDNVEDPGQTAPLARLDVVVRDAPADDLVSFAAILEDLRLVRDDGSKSGALLAGDVEVEFVGLRDRVQWIASLQIEEGIYEAVEVGFTPGSYTARTLSGDELVVDSLADLLVAPIDGLLRLPGGEYARVEVDLDLGTSLTGDVSTGELTFDPRGTASSNDGNPPVRLDDLDALVETRDIATGALSVQAMVADTRSVDLRSTDVFIDDFATLRVGPNGDLFSSTAQYLTLLAPGLGVVELEGFLGFGGELQATCIELEDQNGLQGTHFPVEIEGLVVARPQPNLMTLLVREITRGADQAEPVLIGLGRATIDVLIEPSQLLNSSDGTTLSMEELPLGAEVETKFLFFSGEPFQAERLVLLAVSTFGVPGVEEESAVTGPAPVLDVPHRPVLAPEQLPAGTRVWRSGELALVRPGLLVDGRVSAIDPSARRLTLSSGRVAASFGGHAESGAGPFALEVDPSARIRGAASDLESLARLLETLEPGATLVVEVRGLAAAEPATLRAFELRARIER